MKITQVLSENGPQSKLCNGGACPAAILTDGQDAFVQGYLPNADEANTLTAPAGESFVRIPLPALKKIAAQVVDA